MGITRRVGVRAGKRRTVEHRIRITFAQAANVNVLAIHHGKAGHAGQRVNRAGIAGYREIFGRQDVHHSLGVAAAVQRSALVGAQHHDFLHGRLRVLGLTAQIFGGGCFFLGQRRRCGHQRRSGGGPNMFSDRHGTRIVLGGGCAHSSDCG